MTRGHKRSTKPYLVRERYLMEDRAVIWASNSQSALARFKDLIGASGDKTVKSEVIRHYNPVVRKATPTEATE